MDNLPIVLANKYFMAINALQSREILSQYNVMMMPHVSKGDRDKFVNGLVKSSNPVRKSSGKKLSNKELMEVLKKR